MDMKRHLKWTAWGRYFTQKARKKNNAVPLGLGGGGTMFAPQISPHDSTLIFVACDMTGLYRSTDRGKTWLMCDARQYSRGERLVPLRSKRRTGSRLRSTP